MLKFALALCLFTGTTFAAQPTQSAPQTAAPQTAGTTKDQQSHAWTLEQAISCSVAEAWDLGGKTEEGFVEILKALASLSAQKRGLTLPESKEAGTRAGQLIHKMAKADPDQLLYVIVDKAVQQVGIRPSKK